MSGRVRLKGHRSGDGAFRPQLERYIWRYIQASEDEMEETLESVTDALNGSAQLTEDYALIGHFALLRS